MLNPIVERPTCSQTKLNMRISVNQGYRLESATFPWQKRCMQESETEDTSLFLCKQ